MNESVVYGAVAGLLLGVCGYIALRNVKKALLFCLLVVVVAVVWFETAGAEDRDPAVPTPVYQTYLPFVVGEARDWFTGDEYAAALHADLERGYMRGAQYTGTVCDLYGDGVQRFRLCRAQFYMGGNARCVGWFMRHGLGVTSMWTCSTSDPGDRVPGVQ